MEDMKSAYEWMKDPRIQDRPGQEISVMDPDGWRRPDGVEMEDLINWDDFFERFSQSTISSHAKDAESHQTPA